MKSSFVAYELKSLWEPPHVGERLGFTVDFKEGTLSVTPARVQKALLASIMGMEFPTARFVAKVVGTIIFMGFCLGPVSGMWTCMLYLDIAEASFWDARIFL